MTNKVSVAFVSVIAIVLISARGPAVVAHGNASERGIVVTASNADGSPATHLTAADFIVSEDGRAREVIRVATAPPPSHVMLLVDDSQASERSISFLRSGLTAFIGRLTALKPAPQLALMTFGERPTMRADFAPKADLVQAAAGKIFSVPGTGSYLLQAMMDACKNLSKRAAPAPVIVAFVAETGPEFSSERREQITQALKGAGASLWAVVLVNAGQLDQTTEGLERAAVLGDVVTASGGLTRTVLSNQSLEPAIDGIAALLSSRYLVTYGRPDDLIPPTTVDVTSKRPDVRLVAMRWAR